MKESIRKSIILATMIIALSGISWAEDEDDINLEKIVVTPSRIEENYEDLSRNVDVITEEDIELSGAKDLTQVLTGITSVNMSDYGGLGGLKNIRMRGSTASQVLILLDGRPVNNPRDGEVDLSNIPLANIERVEVMHGPASNLYGSSAMGGVVNIITKRPPKEKQETQFTSSFGTFRTYIEQLVHGAKIGKFGYLISGDYKSSEGFRSNTEFNARDFNAKFEYELNKENSLTLNSGFYKSMQGTPGKISNPDIDDKQRVLNNFLDLSWSFRPEGETLVSAKIYNNYDRLEFIENSAGSVFDTAFSKDIHTTQVRGYDLQFNKRLLNNYLAICGFSYITNLNDSTSSAKHKYTVRAAYLENQLDLFRDLKMSLGVRVDDYSNFGLQPSPSFSLLYKFNENNKLRTSINRNFRAPTFNDLYWPDQGWVKGNPDLKPERGSTAEIGYETNLNKYLSSSLTYYRSNYSQLINWGEEAGVWMPKNIGAAVIQGVELENKIYLPAHFEIDIGYTYLLAKDKKTHKFLVYQPQDKVDAVVRYNGINGLVVELKGQFTGKRFADPNNLIKVKQFFLLGLNLSKKFKNGLTYYASIDNMLARKYQVINEYPMPRFSITSGIKFDF
ncbi:MAG: TonB-dependent receptor [Candidatus Omnitrophica bacterium]|nr:TonB-dependent receptor [Candidatus Omnitrophota bacterium]MDD5237599.1 TonB-dependent receptor [Candidatus Omnitrophota bacterium]